MNRFAALCLPLLALGACTAESGAPDTSRGSADSPMTMMVDQTVNGVPQQGGTQVMIGATDRAQGWVSPRPNFGSGTAPLIPPQGGERR